MQNKLQPTYERGQDYSFALNQKQKHIVAFMDSFSSIATTFSIAKQKDYIGATCWDGKFAIYAVKFFMESLQLDYYGQTSRPLTHCTFSKDGSKFYYANISGSVFCYDLIQEKQTTVLNPQCEVKNIEGLIFTKPPLSFMAVNNNTQYLLYTERSSQEESILKIAPLTSNNQRHKVKLRFQVYQACFKDPYFVAAIRSKHYSQNCNQIAIFDVSSTKKSVNYIIPSSQQINSGHLIQSITISSCKSRIALGKVEGLCYVFDVKINQQNQTISKENQFVWIAHQQKSLTEPTVNLYYSVNCIDFHSSDKNILATGSSDGKIKIWNSKSNNNYELLHVFQHKRIPVNTMKFLDMGKYIAYSIGNDWHLGTNEELTKKSQLRLLDYTKVPRDL